jgi:ribosomal protein S18 acetylase RimI-like enzyme
MSQCRLVVTLWYRVLQLWALQSLWDSPMNDIIGGWDYNDNDTTGSSSSHYPNILYSCHALVHQNQQHRHVPSKPLRNIQIRPVRSSEDLWTIRRRLLQEYMNPLSIRAEHVLVAYDVMDDRLLNRNSDVCNADSVTTSSSKTTNSLVGFGQLRPLDTNDAGSVDTMELASIYVIPQYRHEGIASQIIQALLARVSVDTRNDTASTSDNTRIITTTTTKPVIIFLLTLRPIIPLYERHGFRVVDPSIMSTTITRSTTTTPNDNHDMVTVPIQLQIEWIIGSILSKLLGNELVCMVRQ